MSIDPNHTKVHAREPQAPGCRVSALDYAPAAVELTRQHLRETGQAAELDCADVLQWWPAGGDRR